MWLRAQAATNYPVNPGFQTVQIDQVGVRAGSAVTFYVFLAAGSMHLWRGPVGKNTLGAAGAATFADGLLTVSPGFLVTSRFNNTPATTPNSAYSIAGSITYQVRG